MSGIRKKARAVSTAPDERGRLFCGDGLSEKKKARCVARNLLKRLVLDEEIQGIPNISDPLEAGISRSREASPRTGAANPNSDDSIAVIASRR